MPNRIIKESICTSETISELTDFEFRLWVGLIVSVDDYGRGDARAKIIKGRIFPLRERVSIKDIECALHGLAAKGCVSLYEVDGRPYFWFPTWAKHQRIQTKKSKFPEPSDGVPQKPTVNHGEPPSESESNPNPNPNTKGARETRFVPPTLDDVKAYCKERKNDVDAERFFAYYDAAKWVDGKGDPVRNWKQKVITWERSGGAHPEKKQRSTRKAESWDDLPEGFL